MKKTKFVSLLSLSLLTSVGLVGCGSNAAVNTKEYALVTDVGDIDDASFNQTSWEAVKAFAEANKKTYDYYRPSEDSTDARLASIEQAVNKGAKIVVCPGFLFEEAITTAQDLYKDVKFVLLDSGLGDKVKENTATICYKEQISGFLAGYGAVKDGKTKLGFCGGMAVPSVQRFGSGFVQGVNKAAVDLKKKVDVKYYYAGAFAATADATSKMESWYQGGMETVFACGGKVYQSVITGSKKGSNASWIGVDTDQSKAEDVKTSGTKILTSAVKGLKESVTSSLEAYRDDKWAQFGKTNYNLGLNTVMGPVAAKDYVGLPTETASWGFSTFTLADYNTLIERIKKTSGDDKIEISDDVTSAPTVDATYTTVTYETPFAGN